MVATQLMTIEDLAALDSDLRVELIEGELVEMSPTGPKHGVVVSELAYQLQAYARSQIGLHIAIGEAGFILHRDPNTVVAPDITVLTAQQWDELRTTDESFAPFPPLIAIEVKSPSEREPKITRKLALYLEAGVQEVWWVRPETRQISVHRPDAAPRVLEVDQAIESAELPGFRLDLSALFADIT